VKTSKFIATERVYGLVKKYDLETSINIFQIGQPARDRARMWRFAKYT
jgi:hypothetical protein